MHRRQVRLPAQRMHGCGHGLHPHPLQHVHPLSQVKSRSQEDVGVISKEAQSSVAFPAQQSAPLAGLVAVIPVRRLLVNLRSADGALPVLSSESFSELRLRHVVVIPLAGLRLASLTPVLRPEAIARSAAELLWRITLGAVAERHLPDYSAVGTGQRIDLASAQRVPPTGAAGNTPLAGTFVPRARHWIAIA